jgi:hypothetical protein
MDKYGEKTLRILTGKQHDLLCCNKSVYSDATVVKKSSQFWALKVNNLHALCGPQSGPS